MVCGGGVTALIMMSALQFICYCHDRLAGGVWCALTFCEIVRWLGSVTSIWGRVLLGRGELFPVLCSTHQQCGLTGAPGVLAQQGPCLMFELTNIREGFPFPMVPMIHSRYE